jgi:phenylalanyl-tRNA synthetase beta chain
MKVLQSWIEDYLKISLTTEELVDSLVSTGTDVESLSKQPNDQIIVAKITEVSSHPNADRLRVLTVFNGREAVQVVCGAPNVQKGQTVPLAQVGAKVGGQTIEAAEIRGVLSHGMLCSEKELGLGEDHSGIKILEDELEAGTLLKDSISSDLVFDLEITPNRGDCLSHLGIAREIAAIQGSEIKRPPIDLKMDSENASNKISVSIEDKGCKKYMARVVKGVKVGPSPDWLRHRLTRLGVKSINNIVDVTNYIMLDLGQPLHAFDLAKVEGQGIVVRKAKSKEKLNSLDDQELLLDEEMLVIADHKKPIALAGIIGSTNSSITGDTRDVVIEAAVFDPKIIRKTARKLHISTDASYRYERGVDLSALQYAVDKAAKLMKEVAGGSILSGIVQDGQKEEILEIEIPYAKINNLLDTKIDYNEINRLLRLYGFKTLEGRTAVPSYRHDIFIWQDLAEEVARAYSYKNIKDIKLEKIKPKSKSSYYLKETLKDILVEAGLTEVISYPFTSDPGAASEADLLEVANPVQPENKYLRSSLLHGLYQVIAKNSSFDPVMVFEIGQVFSKKGEFTHLAIAMAGGEKVLSELMEAIGLKLKEVLGNSTAPKVDIIDPKELGRIKIRKPKVLSSEIDITELLSKPVSLDLNFIRPDKEVHYRRVSKYPSVTRDLAFIVDNKVDVGLIIDSIYQINEKVNRVELFDVYSSDKLGIGKKSLAFHIYLQDLTKTLVDIEADEIIKQIIATIKKRFEAELRTR